MQNLLITGSGAFIGKNLKEYFKNKYNLLTPRSFELNCTDTKAVEEYHLEDEITLAGSFCIGKCNRIGVTVQVDDDIHTGITKENFKEFFKENVLDVINKERG